MEVRRALADELMSALGVWQRARIAAGSPPATDRIARVSAKLADPAALVVVARVDGEVVAMAQLETHRSDAGAGHVSMVFVDPDHQGQGLGRLLMESAHVLAADRGWHATSLWTREANAPAQALYRAVGYVPTDDLGQAPSGDPTRRWERRPQRVASASAEATR